MIEPAETTRMLHLRTTYLSTDSSHAEMLRLQTVRTVPGVKRLAAAVCATLLMLAVAGAACAEDKATTSLPDVPSSVLIELLPGSGSPNHTSDVARRLHRVIAPGQTAVPLTAKDKMELSLVTRASLSSTGSSLFSAAFGYWRDDTPHYGTNVPAFGQRFGAAELKATSESFFSYGLYASVFHDDPRYYVLGSEHKLTKRAIYAASRVVITRKDDGSDVPNWPKLAGITSAAALTNAYYPDQDRRFGRTATSVLSSIAVTAGVNELHEFVGDALRLVFHKHPGGDKE